MTRKFDLNIEKILENWSAAHALREVIANALDEHLLRGIDQSILIEKSGDCWVIRDFGRGLNYSHLTQNENKEKLRSSGVIGKFGIGLKDAMATFHRRGISVVAKSKFGTIDFEMSAKPGFSDIDTLHAIIHEPEDISFVGTEFTFAGVTDEDMREAMDMFLVFSGERIVESTPYGDVVSKKGKYGCIYINGVKVAQEENFLFSYNITKLTAPIRKALNRERTNVGRSAYTDAVKKVLLNSSSKSVAEVLANDLTKVEYGTAHDELSWLDVQEHSVKILNQTGNYLFITAFEAMSHPSMVDEARHSGHAVIIIPHNLKDKIRGKEDLSGNPIVDIHQFIDNYNDSFEFSFINANELSTKERGIYLLTDRIVKIFGGLPKKVKEIKISETVRNDSWDGTKTFGCWDEGTRSIVIAREMLKSIKDYSGTVLHELVHAKSGYDDVTREFEEALTTLIGELRADILSH